MMYLNKREIEIAYQEGRKRCENRIDSKKKKFPMSLEENYYQDANAAVAEAEVAKCMGKKWISRGNVPDKIEDGDVEGKIQVRWSKLSYASLIVYDYEPNDLNYVLVVGDIPYMRIAGWVVGEKAKKEIYWKTTAKVPAYFAPQGILRPIHELIDKLR